MASAVRAPSILRNSTWSILSYGGGIVVVLIATPFYIKLLGLEKFGLLTILFSVVAPLGVLNAGMAQATTKYVAEFCAAGAEERAKALVGTTLCLNLILGIVGFIVLTAVSGWIPSRVFKISPGLIADATWGLRITGAIWCCNQLSATFQAVVAGLQDYRAVAIGGLLRQAISYGGGVGLLLHTADLKVLLAYNLFISFLFIMYWFYLANNRLTRLSFWPGWDRASGRLCYRFSAWQALDQFLGIWANQADVLLLGTLSSVTRVGIYGTASSIQQRLVGGVWSALNTVFPAISAASRSPGQAEAILMRTGWRFSLLAGWMYGVGFVFGPTLLPLWVGIDLGTKAAPVLQVLLAAALAGLPSAVFYQYLLGQGLTKSIFYMSLATNSVTIVSSWFLIRALGLPGAAWGALLGLVLTRPLAIWLIIRNRFSRDYSAKACFGKLFSPVISAAVAATVGTVAHASLVRALGGGLGSIVSLASGPFIVACLIVVCESFGMGHRQNILEWKKDLSASWWPLKKYCTFG